MDIAEKVAKEQKTLLDELEKLGEKVDKQESDAIINMLKYGNLVLIKAFHDGCKENITNTTKIIQSLKQKNNPSEKEQKALEVQEKKLALNELYAKNLEEVLKIWMNGYSDEEKKEIEDFAKKLK